MALRKYNFCNKSNHEFSKKDESKILDRLSFSLSDIIDQDFSTSQRQSTD